jgi:hypothetical protein
MDAFLEDGGNTYEAEIDSTPNIEFQLDRFHANEPMRNKCIPVECLFGSAKIREWITAIYKARIDIPILLNGVPGCGKLSLLLGLITLAPVYCPEFPLKNDKPDKPDNRRINNIIYLKSLDREYPKLLSYENLFMLNIKTLCSNTEIITYLKYIFKLSRSRSIDAAKKIFILAHIECCTNEQQRYIGLMMDKINDLTCYILTTTKINGINRKITASCACMNYGRLDKTTFCNIFTTNYKNVLDKQFLLIPYLEKYYQLYLDNNYNLGNTIAQIKYLLCNGNPLPDKIQTSSDGNDSSGGIIEIIARNFIKKRMKLATVNTALDIRRNIYTLLSINIDLLNFCKIIIRQLMTSKLNNKIKGLILEQGGILSRDIIHVNKDIVAVETFIYALINIIYSGGVAV